MSPSRLHERVNRLFCLFLSRITRAFGLEVVALGSTTLRRPEVFKAVEPDSCFFIGSPSAVRMALRRGDDLSPNLAIEVDVTRKSLDRLPIYATLDVPEVWRYSGGTIEVYLLRNDEYEKSPASRLFPRLPVAELARFLDLRDRMGDNEIGDAFRAWLGEQSAGSD
jgi:Uma2 family endonuclease